MFRLAVLSFCLFIVLTKADRKVQVTACFSFVGVDGSEDFQNKISDIPVSLHYLFFTSDNHV